VRWGLKEVRLGATKASLLHWLYPRAKFVILSRHPHDCYRSLADSGWNHVYYQRPQVRVDSAAGFGRHWNRLATGWSELPADFPRVHIKYEDLINGKVDFRRLESWLGIEIRENVALSVFVGRTAVRQSYGKALGGASALLQNLNALEIVTHPAVRTNISKVHQTPSHHSCERLSRWNGAVTACRCGRVVL
jgi:hypothetical protein